MRPLLFLFLNFQTHVIHLLETKHYVIAIGLRIIIRSELDSLNLSEFTCKLLLQLFSQAVNVRQFQDSKVLWLNNCHDHATVALLPKRVLSFGICYV